MSYVIAFVVGLVGGVVGETIRKHVDRRREWKRGEKMRAANRKAFQEEVAKPWDPPVRVDRFIFAKPDLPLSALEYARRAGKGRRP